MKGEKPAIIHPSILGLNYDELFVLWCSYTSYDYRTFQEFVQKPWLNESDIKAFGPMHRKWSTSWARLVRL